MGKQLNKARSTRQEKLKVGLARDKAKELPQRTRENRKSSAISSGFSVSSGVNLPLMRLFSSRARKVTLGRLEFLPIPTEIHESLVQFLFFAIYRYVDSQKLGKVYSSGIRLRIRPKKSRLPDIIFLHKDNFHARHNRLWDGADLVVEVVSDDPKDRRRDYEEKLADYAEGGVAEYWIVDYERKLIIVH